MHANLCSRELKRHRAALYQHEDLPIAEAPDAVVEAVPALAQVFRASPLQASSEEKEPQAPAGSTPDVHSDSAGHGDAALQLEALRVLLLILPLPMPQVMRAIQTQS